MDCDVAPALRERVDRIIVIGGDGTLIGVARALVPHPIPLIGVNVGKLGFLAEFSLAELKAHFEQVLSDDALVRRRAVLDVQIVRAGGSTISSPAVNDCVVQAGPPFRLIRLGVSIDGEKLTDVGGDGLIVCTPSGSTAHNLSAGGPIMQSDVDAIILTPLNPHSLTHKPVVIDNAAVIEVEAIAVNAGTTVIIDGQVSHPLGHGDRVAIRRSPSDFYVVRNPHYGRWHKLITKLHWGQSPAFEQ